MSQTISLVLADDHALLCGALVNRFEAESDLTVLAQVGTADDAVTRSLELRPDVVLMDIDMPGQVAFDAARKIKTRCPATRVIFLSAFSHDRYIEQALAVEASGYIIKTEPIETVIEAIRKVASGMSYYSPDVQCRIVFDGEGIQLSDRAHTRASTLSARELEVLRYIAQGLTKKEIGAVMLLSVKTIEAHTSHLMAKLGIHDRVDLARFAIREGLAEA
ncbi:MAG: response regulator transcription factor [Phycisphaerae bacterium]|nr:response regulator transcription factor [Phycisphaerae bacterium]